MLNLIFLCLSAVLFIYTTFFEFPNYFFGVLMCIYIISSIIVISVIIIIIINSGLQTNKTKLTDYMI